MKVLLLRPQGLGWAAWGCVCGCLGLLPSWNLPGGSQCRAPVLLVWPELPLTCAPLALAPGCQGKGSFWRRVEWTVTDRSREPVLDSGSWQACFPSRRRPSTASSMAPQKLRGPWQTQFFLIPTTEQPPLPRMRPRRRLAELRAGSFGHLQALL